MGIPYGVLVLVQTELEHTGSDGCMVTGLQPNGN